MSYMENGVEDDHVAPKDQSLELNIHTFSDLSSVSPVVFLFLLVECYVNGHSTAFKKYRALEYQVSISLLNAPRPGPAVFTVQCFYALPLFGSYADGFGQMIVSVLRKFLQGYTNYADLEKAQDLAAQLFLDVVQGVAFQDERILIKIIEVFDVKLVNFERVLKSSDNAEAFMKQYIFDHIESKSYFIAVSLLKQFNIRHGGETFLHKMIKDRDFEAARKWASYKGKSMLCVLVEEFVKMNTIHNAFWVTKRNNLQEEFPDVYHKYNESVLKDLAERGFWDVAEEKARNDEKLLEYLVFMAMEAGYTDKVAELCDRYSLEGFVKVKEPKITLTEDHDLRLHELFIEDIIWVDGADSLQTATSYLEKCKVVGFDSEWTVNDIEGMQTYKVSIMQIASEKVAYILDMIKLYDDAPDVLNSCLGRIFNSPIILKLGYTLKTDIHQMHNSFLKLDCFNRYEMLLDIKKVFREPHGGLSALVKKVLGVGLDKTLRSSDWGQRPLTQQQKEYAVLDAVVLIHLFHKIPKYSHPSGTQNSIVKMEWKSRIYSKLGYTKWSWENERTSEEEEES